MELLIESIQLIILAVSFIVGQVIHICKSNQLDNKRQFRDWYKDNSISFWVQSVAGLGVLEVLMSQLAIPTSIFGWFAFIYAGLNAGIAGSSVSITANREIKKRSKK